MTTQNSPSTSQSPSTPQSPSTSDTETSWWTGRSGLVVPLVLFAFCTYLLVGILTMNVPVGVDSPGPKFFPTLVVISGYIVSAVLVVQYIRKPEPADVAEDSEYGAVPVADEQAPAKQYRFFSDWQCIAWATFGFLAFALLLNPVGWILSAALLFWCVARAMDSKRPLLDLVVGLMMSSIAYLAFDVLLGLNLPSGLLGGL